LFGRAIISPTKTGREWGKVSAGHSRQWTANLPYLGGYHSAIRMLCSIRTVAFAFVIFVSFVILVVFAVALAAAIVFVVLVPDEGPKNDRNYERPRNAAPLP
jgi:Flp pilus assembly protein TadB